MTTSEQINSKNNQQLWLQIKQNLVTTQKMENKPKRENPN